MKKKTNEEMLQKIDEACELINQASKLIIKAKKILKSCGFHVIGDIRSEALENWELVGGNVFLRNGILKMAEAVGVKTYHRKDFRDSRRYDKERMYLNYKNLVFYQHGEEKNKRETEFVFE